MPSGRSSRRRRRETEVRVKSGTDRSRTRDSSNASHSNTQSFWSRFTVPQIIGRPALLDDVREHPLRTALSQLVMMAIITAAVGTLVGKFVPDALLNNVSNGIYLAGLVTILLVETVWQWLIRAASLTAEEGIGIYARTRRWRISEEQVREFLESKRADIEAGLKRSFEPVERVGLILVAILVHLIAQKSVGVSPVPPWANTLSQDWTITLLLAFAGLLWQLKNPSNIDRLSAGLNLEKFLMKFGGIFWTILLVILVFGSMGVLSFLFFPWGLTSILLLVLLLRFSQSFSN